MAGSMKWHGDEAEARIRAGIARNLAAAAILVADRAKELLSVDGTAVAGGGRDARGRFRGRRLRYGANPSAPGEPPRLQTGRLRGSVAWEVVDLVARVGTNVLYGKFLEQGTRRMAARPWLRRALFEAATAVRAILGRRVG